jgi:AraC-like DNA-binding protein
MTDEHTPEELAKIEQAKAYLLEGKHTAMQIAGLLGFGHRYDRYLALFRKVTGGTPSQFLAGKEIVATSEAASQTGVPSVTETVSKPEIVTPVPAVAPAQKLEDIVVSVPAMQKVILEKTKKLLLEKYSLDYIANELGYSNGRELSTAFQVSTGSTASDWYKSIMDNRVDYVEGRLRNGEHPNNFYKDYGYTGIKQLIKSYRINRKGKTIGEFLRENNITIKGLNISDYESKKQVEASKPLDKRFRKEKLGEKSGVYIVGSVETTSIKLKLDLMHKLLPLPTISGTPVYMFSKELASMMGGRVTPDGIGIFIARILIEKRAKGENVEEIKKYLPQVVELSAGREIAKRLYGFNKVQPPQ